jgi:rhodanese-related sulfurtransferase
MPRLFAVVLTTALLTLTVGASEKLPPSSVDFDGFLKASLEAEKHRAERLVDLDRFLAMAKEKNTIILDTRSEKAYKRKHVKGAVHLNFSDFTDEKLAKVIPSKDTRILIYCNNNFEGDVRNFAAKRVSLALNVPTYVNLYGYGYRNVYELSRLVRTDHKKLTFAGTDVK